MKAEHEFSFFMCGDCMLDWTLVDETKNYFV